MKSLRDPDATAVVGVVCDEAGQTVLRTAIALAQRTGLRLEAVTVTEPLPAGVYSYDPYAAAAGTWDGLCRELSEAQRRVAEDRLAALASSCPAASSVSTRVLQGGWPAEVLTAEAKARRAALLIVGAAATSHRLTPRGWSTALGAMALSTVPVLILRAGCALDVQKEAPTLLLADDLTGEGGGVVAGGCELARAFGRVDVVHAHVVDRRLVSLFSRRHAAAEAQIAARAEAELRRRGARLAEAIEAAGGRYRTEVVVGRAADEVMRETQRLRPDVVVFGRHRPLHYRPFGIGKVPFAAMLGSDSAVLVMPPEGRLSAGAASPAPARTGY